MEVDYWWMQLRSTQSDWLTVQLLKQLLGWHFVIRSISQIRLTLPQVNEQQDTLSFRLHDHILVRTLPLCSLKEPFFPFDSFWTCFLDKCMQRT